MVISYGIGCIVDTPRACMRSDIMSDRGVDSMCLDLHSLTHHVYGVSQTDMNTHFLAAYLKTHILAKDPYDSIDKFGVGTYVDIAVDKIDNKVKVCIVAA